MPKTTDTAPKTHATPTATRRWTLDDVFALAPAHPPKLRDFLLRRVSDASLLARGQKIDTQNILDSIPDFVASVRTSYAALSDTQRGKLVGYSPALDVVLAGEAKTLQQLKSAFDAGSKAGATARATTKAKAAETWSRAIGLRDQGDNAMKTLLGDESEGRAELKETKGDAETAQSLHSGCLAMADLIDSHRRADKETIEVMDELGLTAAFVADLRAAAEAMLQAAKDADAAEPTKRVSQRQLDIQDGRALHFVAVIYKAWKGAAQLDSTILLPKLGAMQPLIDRQRAPKEPTANPPDAPVKPA